MRLGPELLLDWTAILDKHAALIKADEELQDKHAEDKATDEQIKADH